MADIKTAFTDAVGPAAVPTKATHGGVTSEPGASDLPGMDKSPNCPAVIVRDGFLTSKPKVSGPVKTAFDDTVN